MAENFSKITHFFTKITTGKCGDKLFNAEFPHSAFYVGPNGTFIDKFFF